LFVRQIATTDAELKEMKKQEEESGGMGMDEVEAKVRLLTKTTCLLQLRVG
jgi:hypothetical protein